MTSWAGNSSWPGRQRDRSSAWSLRASGRVRTAQAGEDTRVRAAQELTGLAWWELDLRTGKQVWSAEMYRLVGLSPADPARGTELRRVRRAAPPGRPGARRRSSGRAVSPPGAGTSSGSSSRTAAVQLSAVLDRGRARRGRAAVRVLGATIDVTDRESALQAEAESRAILAAALDLNATAVWEWDVEDRDAQLVGPDDGADGVRPAAQHRPSRASWPAAPGGPVRIREIGGGPSRREPGGVDYRIIQPDGAVRSPASLD